LPPVHPVPFRLISMAKYNWVIVFADNTKLKVAKARGAMDAAVTARLRYKKFDSLVTQMQRHSGHNPGLMYRAYRWKRGADPTLQDYRVLEAMRLSGYGQQMPVVDPQRNDVASPAPAAPPSMTELGIASAENIRLQQRIRVLEDDKMKLAERIVELEKELQAERSKPRTFKRIM